MSRAVLILLVAAGTAAAARPALADPMVTITPPAGPGVRAYRNDFRTTDRQPLFRIAGTGGTTLQCGLDDATTSPCDAADTACIAAVCATYRPPGALGGGSHTLSVQLDDAHGAEVAENSFDFVVDTTPPDTIGVSADGPALRPVFSFTVDEDDTLAPADTAQCSFTAIGAPTVWTGCATGLSLTGTGLDGGYRVPVPLPRRHADYRFMARGIDDFGRMDPTPAQYVYDPVPCAVAARPASIAAVIA
ncbi:MAG: hypothetical protein JWM71_139, partial [Solirubrobacteraceae bacterium]|nr:hypothetical protein [Solirubrobacteraceae bacterium]